MTEPRGIQSINIGFRVLDAIASSPHPMKLKDIAAATQMEPSKVRFYLVSFLQIGLVSQSPDSGHYKLGPYGIKLGLAALEQWDVVTAARRYMYELSDTLGFTSFLAVWGNRGPTVVFRMDGRNRTVLEIRVGSVLPLLETAIGQVFLSFLPEPVTRAYLAEELAEARNAHLGAAKQKAAHVDRVVERTRKAGLGIAHGSLLAGFTAIAAPIFDHAGLTTAAISVIGPIGDLDDSPDGLPARLLKEKTSLLSEQAGWASAQHASDR